MTSFGSGGGAGTDDTDEEFQYLLMVRLCFVEIGERWKVTYVTEFTGISAHVTPGE